MSPQENERMRQKQEVIGLATEEEKKKLDNLENERNELKHEFFQIKDDKATANLHRVALAKKENNQTLSQDEEIAISDIKTAYADFFESEDEGSDPEVETSPEYKERKRVSHVIESIQQDLEAKAIEFNKSVKDWNDMISTIRSRLAETSRTSVPESSSVNQSPSDYVDSLPKQHNPFDDIGDD